MWNVVLTDDDLNIDAEGVGRSKHFDHAATRGAAWRGEAGDLDINGKAFEGRARIFGINGLEGAASFVAEHAVRRICAVRDLLIALGDGDGAADALVEGRYVIARKCHGIKAMVCPSVVEDADDGGIAAGENAGDAPGTASVTPWKCFIYKD